jgi:FkbM family methyltransferase
MSIPIDGSLEKWLQGQLAAHSRLFAGKSLVLDVGAYHGDFAASALSASAGCFQRALLFEPNPANQAFLKKRFADNSAVGLESVACDSAPGEHDFFCAGETYTGSLLPYEATAGAAPVRTTVRCVVLDAFLQEKGLLNTVGFLKIDTQGNDLRVLQGAPVLLQSVRPWIVCELIYSPLYQAQAAPHEIAQFLAGFGYVMAAQFNENYSGDGWLAWSDACFVPREVTGSPSAGYESRPTAELERNSRRSVAQRIRKQIHRTFRHGRD